jgi:hypothetical protein
MNDFRIWFGLGLEHLLELGALDHILFLAVLSISFTVREWRKTLLLLVGFTIGHTVSMLFSVLFNWQLSVPLVEFGIAMSILASVVLNLPRRAETTKPSLLLIAGTVTMFGCIHGLGFSLLLRSMLGAGDQLLFPLIYFNLGLETAQCIIVVLVLLFSLFLTALIKIPGSTFKLSILCVIGSIALFIAVQRLWQLFFV